MASRSGWCNAADVIAARSAGNLESRTARRAHDPACPHRRLDSNDTRMWESRAQKQGGSPERHEEGISLPSKVLVSARSPTLARKKAPPTKRGQVQGSSCARTAAWMEVPAPRACPQIASVELV